MYYWLFTVILPSVLSIKIKTYSNYDKSYVSQADIDSSNPTIIENVMSEMRCNIISIG